jgi:hypothetical protein
MRAPSRLKPALEYGVLMALYAPVKNVCSRFEMTRASPKVSMKVTRKGARMTRLIARYWMA